MPHGRRSGLCSVRLGTNSSATRPAKNHSISIKISHRILISPTSDGRTGRPLSFAPSLVKLIASSPHQEVATPHVLSLLLS